MSALRSIFKKYDIRGLVGEQLTPQLISAIAAGFVDSEQLSGKDLVIGEDMRNSSKPLADAFASGAIARGANVVRLGLCSTDQCYFASGSLAAAAAMFTASHNPASYNGIKLSRSGARGISMDSGLLEILELAERYLEQGIPLAKPGVERNFDSLPDYAQALRKLCDLSGIRPIKIVIDAANGMAGLTAPAVLGTAAQLAKLPIEIVPMYFELDGSFPNHEANPLDPKNLVDLQRRVVETGADLGLAFDGDADRAFVVDEKGNPVSPSAVAAIVAEGEIARAKELGVSSPVVLHNLLTSKYVSEKISSLGATPIRTRVGHSLIKDEMAKTGAVFGAEHSAHYYFKDFYSADNGMLAAMQLIQRFGSQQRKLSEFASDYDPYFSSGEINSAVANPRELLETLKTEFSQFRQDELDGLTVYSDSTPWWWFNVRPSNTEPLIRLNVESEQQKRAQQLTQQLLGLIRGPN